MVVGERMTIKCVESSGGCKECIFTSMKGIFPRREDTRCEMLCMNYERPDKKTVVFVEVKD